MRTIVIGGGGVGGAFSLGVLSRLRHYNLLKLPTRTFNFAGSSVGAILAAALAQGVHPRTLADAMWQNKDDIFAAAAGITSQLQHLILPSDSAPILGAKYDYAQLLSFIRRVLPRPDTLASDPSLRNLLVTLYDTNAGRVIDAATTKLSIADAVANSCAAPSFFETPSRFIDGGIGANLPVIQAKQKWPSIQSCLALPNGGSYATEHASEDWSLLRIPAVIAAMMSGQVQSAIAAGRLLFTRFAVVDTDLDFALDDTTALQALFEAGREPPSSTAALDWEAADDLP